uniref:Eukaryotic translation initiation factor 5B n=1 Tax=Sinocyclocheilus grahami TaxID=75366 RepID=A0A672RVT8_SINGR
MENERRAKDTETVAAPAPAVAASDSEDEGSRSRQKHTAKKKGGRKGASDSEDDEDGGAKKGEGAGDNDESDDDSQAARKKKSKAKPDSEEDEGEESAFKVKTAAQKKAEKKERERKKKEEEKAKQRAKKEKEEEALKKETGKPATTPSAESKEIEAEASVEQDAADVQGEEEAEGDKKKKDKKKKKGEKEEKEKDKKKGPSKATVKAMQEALARMKEEEEQAKREEEERQRRLEELEAQRQEQERLEAERKEKKKQKDKERKERLKKEGKLLTKAQKEARARAEATLRVLQAQGVEVPSKDAMPKKKPVYSDKRKKKPTESEDEEDNKDRSNKMSTNKAGKEPSSESSSESDSDDDRSKEERLYDKAKRRIEKRRQENLKNINFGKLRSPVVCVLGHVDTGKTKILDKLRHTHVQDSEAGGITQQIGATNVPLETILEQTKMVKNFDKENVKVPGMLIIDTPGHESFSNLRNRGSSLCDISILVVDIMHGLEPQTIESINLLKEKKCPFIVALNKIDRLYDWKKSPDTDVVATLKKQKKNTKDEFDERAKAVIVEFAQQGLNAALFYENKDPRTFVSLVPTSAHSGDGMGNLIALLVELTQTMLARRLAHCDELRAQVMEVKALPGMGTTIDVILINGCLREGETIIVPGVDGPIITQIRGLLLPPPLKELRVKNPYEKHKEVSTAQGVKILGKDLEKTLAGLPLLVAHKEDEIPVLKDELIRELKQTLNSIKLEEKGVYVQASTLGSLEALLEFLRTSKVPYAGINIGPVHKKDVMKASTMLEHDPQYAVILAFDVKIERDSQELADSLGVRIFSAEIIYHLFDAFTKYREDYKKQKQDEFKHIAVFPCKLRILPQFIFNSRDPIVMGVIVEAGVLRTGTPVCVPSKGITRQSIDALKNWFRDEMQKSDWQLIMELKKTFEII